MVGSALPINGTDIGSATRTIRAWFYLVTPQGTLSYRNTDMVAV